MFALHMLVELLGLIFGDGQISPGRSFNELAGINDLPDMMRIMGQLAVDGIDDDQRFASDSDGFEQILFFQGLEGIEQAGPALIPIPDQLLASKESRIVTEFLVSFPPAFFAVLRQKIRPAAEHIAAYMLYDDRNAVGLLIGRKMKVFFFELGKGFVAKL